jgi:hypothetical protein
MFSKSVSLIDSIYLPVHSNNTIAIAEAAAAAAPPPPQSPAAAVIFFFLFSTKGPFQGHTLPLQGNIVYLVYFLPILLILDVFHQFQLPCYLFLSFSLSFLHFYSKFFYFKFINFFNPHFYRIIITFSYVR